MPRKILVADDDKAMLNIYTRLFAATSYSVSKAASFTEAARLIKTNSYDLLITDLLLGDGLGTDLIKLFESERAGAKSLLVTGSVEQADPELLPEIYFEKPFDFEIFMATVTAALETGADTAQPA
jgi:DNA-binding NtrC family response regulator